MPIPSDKELAAAIETIAVDAGDAIMEIYRQDFAVETKADKSVVTAADKQAEKVIIAALEALAPEIPIVAEEKAAAGDIPDVDGGVFWLVDPLDGTKEFISRNGEFTVNIALIRDGMPCLGVVHVPAKDTTYVGAGYGQAFRRVGGGEAEPIQCRPVPAENLIVVASKSHLSPETETYLQSVSVGQMTQAGSSLKFCLLATGEADLYPRHGRTMEWDTAAGHAVLSAAGGRVSQTDGTPLRYGKQPIFDNPHFIAWGATEASAQATG